MHGIALSPEGRYLATTNADGTAYILRLANQGDVYEIPPEPLELKPKAALNGHDGPITWTAFAPDGRTLISAGKDGVCKLWDLPEGKERRRVTAHDSGVRVLASAGKTLATAGFDGIIRLWDADGNKLHDLPGHKGGVAPLFFAPKSGQLLSGGADGCVRFWNAATGEQARQLEASKDWITHLSLSPDEKTLATGGNDWTVRLWDLESGQERKSLPERTGACFSPDGARLAVITRGHRIEILDAKTCSVRAILTGHTDAPDCLSFSTDGRLLASSGLDGSVRLWDARRGHLLALLTGLKGRAWSVALSADGKTAAAGGEDGQVLLWDLAGLSR
jgi:WD40 repeat protein